MIITSVCTLVPTVLDLYPGTRGQTTTRQKEEKVCEVDCRWIHPECVFETCQCDTEVKYGLKSLLLLNLSLTVSFH